MFLPINPRVLTTQKIDVNIRHLTYPMLWAGLDYEPGRSAQCVTTTKFVPFLQIYIRSSKSKEAEMDLIIIT